MTFLEKDLEDIVFSTKNDFLMSRGLYISGKKARQLKIGNYGISDIVTVSRNHLYDRLSITVFELKKDTIGVSTFMQAIRYAKGIDSWLRKNKQIEFDLSITLIGRTIDMNSDLIYLADVFENVELYTYEYEFDGIRFKQYKRYSLINEGF